MLARGEWDGARDGHVTHPPSALGYVHFDTQSVTRNPLAALINEEDVAVHNVLFVGPVQYLGLTALVKMPEEYTPVWVQVIDGVPYLRVHAGLGMDAVKASLGGATIMRFSGSSLHCTANYGEAYERHYDIPPQVLQWMQDLLVYVDPEMLRLGDPEEFYDTFRRTRSHHDAQHDRFAELDQVCAPLTLEQLVKKYGVQVIGKALVDAHSVART